ncbi:thiamine biosynthesis protein ThiF [Actinomyces sp. zg296]|uniref:thiamine biosynthesis protein ThiF n=1 Tax=Actinomyces sp. zg296 TaxID=2609289 RepID=UPI00135C1B43|nr:thiamine biosynthesis protein ThiF [Actinomyces sp. zg296]
MRLRGASPVLWRGPGECQIGAEAGNAIVLTGMSAAEQRLIDRLDEGIDRVSLSRSARLAGLPLRRAHELVGRLREAGMLHEEPFPGGGRKADDLLYWERLRSPGGASARARRLGEARLAVLGRFDDGAPGLIAREATALLAEAGVGTVLAEDPALDAAVAQSFPTTARRAPLRAVPDLMLTVEPHLIDPIRARSLARADAPHLPVVVREVSVRVGPLLEPGRALCAACLDLHERDADPRWPVVATQERGLPAPRIERLLAHQASGLVARTVLEALADGPGTWAGRSLEISGAEPLGLERQWLPHPECACAALESE